MKNNCIFIYMFWKCLFWTNRPALSYIELVWSWLLALKQWVNSECLTPLVLLSKFLLLYFRYCLEKEDANDYVLCDVIGKTGADNQWKRECFRVVGDNEKPLMLQSLWKPKEGFSRRFEIQLRASVEEQSLKDRDTVTAGIHPTHTSTLFMKHTANHLQGHRYNWVIHIPGSSIT